MRKGLLTVVAITITYMCMAQGGVFEKAFVEQVSPRDVAESAVTSVEWYNNNWVTFGSKTSCYDDQVRWTDVNGSTVTDPSFNISANILGDQATYTASVVIGNELYACGLNYIADDYPAPDRHGFIDGPDGQGNIVRLVEDTSYPGGFADITSLDGKLFVLGSIDDWQLTGSGDDYLVAYDSAGVYINRRQIPDNPKKLQAAGAVVSVFYADTALFFNTSLQDTSISLPTFTNFDQATQYGTNGMAFSLDNVLHVLDSSYGVVRSKSFTGLLQQIDLMASSNTGLIAVMGVQAGQQYLYVLDDQLNVIDSFMSNPCGSINDIALNDSNVVVAGTELLSNVSRGFIKSFAFNGVSVETPQAVNITAASMIIDSLLITDSIVGGMGPGRNIYFMELGYHIDYTVTNNSTDTVRSFTVHEEEPYTRFNCSVTYTVSYEDAITLAPGASVSLSTANVFIPDYALDDPNGMQLKLQLRNINNGIYADTCVPPYVLRRMFTGIHDKGLAEASIQLFPNPAQNQIQLKGLSQPAVLRLYNVQDQQVLDISAHDKTPIDVSELGAGIYFYQLLDEAGAKIVSGKLIKNK